MFTPNYMFDLEAFVVRMPTTYSAILLDSPSFTCGDDIKYHVQPKEFVSNNKRKLTDTGDYWGHVHVSALSLIDEEHTLSFIKAQFIRVNLNPVEVTLQEDKKLGTGTNKYRVSFLPGPDLDVRNLITLGELRAPDGNIWYTHLSKGAATKLGVCLNCLGIESTRAPFHVQCKCSGQKSSGQAGSSAHRARARKEHQARALRRAQKDDPFA